MEHYSNTRYCAKLANAKSEAKNYEDIYLIDDIEG